MLPQSLNILEHLANEIPANEAVDYDFTRLLKATGIDKAEMNNIIKDLVQDGAMQYVGAMLNGTTSGGIFITHKGRAIIAQQRESAV